MDFNNIKNIEDIRKYIKDVKNVKDVQEEEIKNINDKEKLKKALSDSNISIKDFVLVQELLHNYLSGWQARNESQYTVLIHLLDTLTKHQEKLNSKVANHEKRLNDFLITSKIDETKTDEYRKTRAETCPLLDDIQGIKTDQITEKRAKRLFYKGVAIFASIIGSIWAIFQIISSMIGG